MKQLATALILFSLTLLSWAGAPTVGSKLADLTIDDRGEMLLDGDDISYTAWNYPQQPGKVHVVQYMAATMAASKINEPFTDRMKTDLEGVNFTSTTILNLDDAMWGTTGFVVSEVKSNKRAHPMAILILDEDGAGRETWNLEKKGSAVIVVDAAGNILFAKQGPMSDEEIESTLQLIREHGGAASS